MERDLWPVFEGNVIVRLFSKLFSVSSEAIVFPIDPYYYVLQYLIMVTVVAIVILQQDIG